MPMLLSVILYEYRLRVSLTNSFIYIDIIVDIIPVLFFTDINCAHTEKENLNTIIKYDMSAVYYNDSRNTAFFVFKIF